MKFAAKFQPVIRRVFAIAISAGLPAGLISCTGHDTQDSAVKNLSEDDANRLNSTNRFGAMPKDPDFNAETYFAAGQLQQSQGQLPEALANYRAALKLEPNNEKALFGSGVVLAQMKQYPQAIETWKRYCAVTKGNTMGYSNLAFCYELSGHGNEAEANYKKAIAQDGSFKAARNNYGRYLVHQGRMDEGLAQFTAVMKPADANYNVGLALEQMGKTPEARTYYNKAIQLDPKLAAARKRLAELE